MAHHVRPLLIALTFLGFVARPAVAQDTSVAAARLVPRPMDPRLHASTIGTPEYGEPVVLGAAGAPDDRADTRKETHTLEGMVIGGVFSGIVFARGMCETFECEPLETASVFLVGAIPGVVVGALIGYAIPKNGKDEEPSGSQTSINYPPPEVVVWPAPRGLPRHGPTGFASPPRNGNERSSRYITTVKDGGFQD